MPAGYEEPVNDLCSDTLLPILDALEAQIRTLRSTISSQGHCAATADDIKPRPTEVLHRSHQRMTMMTPRQQEVIAQLSQGLSNRQIAHRLAMSEATVKSHLYAAYRKLGVTSRSEAILELLKQGCSEPDRKHETSTQ